MMMKLQILRNLEMLEIHSQKWLKYNVLRKRRPTIEKPKILLAYCEVVEQKERNKGAQILLCSDKVFLTISIGMFLDGTCLLLKPRLIIAIEIVWNAKIFSRLPVIVIISFNLAT